MITALLPVPVQSGSCPKRTTSVKVRGLDKNGFSQCFSFDEESYIQLGGGGTSTDANTSRRRVKQKKNPAPPFAKFFLEEQKAISMRTRKISSKAAIEEFLDIYESKDAHKTAAAYKTGLTKFQNLLELHHVSIAD